MPTQRSTRSEREGSRVAEREADEYPVPGQIIAVEIGASIKEIIPGVECNQSPDLILDVNPHHADEICPTELLHKVIPEIRPVDRDSEPRGELIRERAGPSQDIHHPLVVTGVKGLHEPLLDPQSQAPPGESPCEIGNGEKSRIGLKGVLVEYCNPSTDRGAEMGVELMVEPHGSSKYRDVVGILFVPEDHVKSKKEFVVRIQVVRHFQAGLVPHEV